MSTEKSGSLARRMELLRRAVKEPIPTAGNHGIPATNKDLNWLWREGYLKQCRVDIAERSSYGKRKPVMVLGFQITQQGVAFRYEHSGDKEVLRAETAAENAVNIEQRMRYYRPKDLLGQERDRQRGMPSAEQRRISSETARLIHAALLEAEEEPFVLDTGWIEESELPGHFLWKMLRSKRTPDDGFTLYDRFERARTLRLRRWLGSDVSYREEFDLMVVRTLGGGAAVCHVQEDRLPEQQAIHEKMYAEFCETLYTNPQVAVPDYPKLPHRHRLLLLSSGSGMNTYLQMAFR